MTTPYYDEYTKTSTTPKKKGKKRELLKMTLFACLAVAASPLIVVFCLSNCLCGCPHIALCGNDKSPMFATRRGREKWREEDTRAREERRAEQQKWEEEREKREGTVKSA